MTVDAITNLTLPHFCSPFQMKLLKLFSPLGPKLSYPGTTGIKSAGGAVAPSSGTVFGSV